VVVSTQTANGGRSGSSRAQTTVLFVDDDADLLGVVAEAFAVLGSARTVQAGSLTDVERRRDEVLSSALAILDINLGPNAPSGIDVYRWLERAHYAGKVVFLTGYADDDPAVRDAATIGHVPILRKPIPFETLAKLAAEIGGAP
jgi:DNA-binding NtrC family response regulator